MKDKMNKKVDQHSFEQQKLDLIRLRIQNGYYENIQVLENVVKEILKKEIKNN